MSPTDNNQVRVPFADGTAVVFSGIPDRVVLLNADVFPTGFFAAKNAFRGMTAKLIAQATVVVLGCGYVKLQSGETCF